MRPPRDLVRQLYGFPAGLLLGGMFNIAHPSPSSPPRKERKKIEAVVEARRREIEASVEIARSRSARRQGARSSLMARPSRCTATEVMP